MHRCPAHSAVRRRHGLGGQRNVGHAGRHAMTAPLKHSDPITVDVALGSRAYDIVIGRDVLPSLGARITALRPGVRAAIVTDRTVARHWLENTEASLSEAGIASSRIIVDEGEGSKTYAGPQKGSEARKRRFSPGWRPTTPIFSKAVLRANTRSPPRAAPRRRSWRATSARPGSARCSIWAIPSVMRWRLRPGFPTGCSMAKAWRSAWCWRPNFPRSSG